MEQDHPGDQDATAPFCLAGQKLTVNMQAEPRHLSVKVCESAEPFGLIPFARSLDALTHIFVDELQVFSPKQAQRVYDALREAAVPNIKDELPEELEGLGLWREEDEPSLNL